MPAAAAPVPKLAVLVSSAIASLAGAAAMWRMPENKPEAAPAS